MRLAIYRCSVAVLTVLVVVLLVAPHIYGAEGGDAWRKEFDDVCGRTMEAQSFSIEELERLVTRCEKLKPQIEALGESERKVFLRRLKMCRDLFQYCLDAKKP